MSRLFAFLFLSLTAITSNAATLLFTNKIPAETSGPDYMTGVQAIADAIAAGKRVFATASLAENGGTARFYTDFVAVKVTIAPPGDPVAGQPYFVSGILAMRPKVDNAAEAIGNSPLTSGSFDSWGRYLYNGIVYNGYVISWWAE